MHWITSIDSTGCGSTRRTGCSTTARGISWRNSRRVSRESVQRTVRSCRGRSQPRDDYRSRRQDGGWGLDGVWADDLHHVRRSVGRRQRTATIGTTPDPSRSRRTLRQGWLFCGQHSGVRIRGAGPTRRCADWTGWSSACRITIKLGIGHRRASAPPDRSRRCFVRSSALLLTRRDAHCCSWGRSGPHQPVPVLHRSRATAGVLVTEGRRASSRISGVDRSRARAAHPDPRMRRTSSSGASSIGASANGPSSTRSLAVYTDLPRFAEHAPRAGAAESVIDATVIDDATIAMRREPAVSVSWSSSGFRAPEP